MKIIYTNKNEQVQGFLQKHDAASEQVLETSAASIWGCAVEDNTVVGVIGIILGQYANRINAFFVVPEYRNRGIGTELLHDILQREREKKTAAFCTNFSEPLFLKEGFKITREQDTSGFSFVELRREK